MADRQPPNSSEPADEIWGATAVFPEGYVANDPIHNMTNEMIHSDDLNQLERQRSSLKRRASEERLQTPLKLDEKNLFPESRQPTRVEKFLCGYFRLPTRLVLCASIGSFLFGFNLSLLNTSLSTIASEYGWCSSPGDVGCTSAMIYKAFVSTAVFIGAAVGSMTGGRFLFIGRRTLCMLTMIFFVVGVVSSVTANSFSALLWARLLVGCGVGVVSFVVPVYMSEMTPPEKRGSYGVFHQLFITVGIFVGVILGLPLQPFPTEESEMASFALRTFDKVWWRVMLGLGIIPVLVALYFFYFVFTFETPHFLVQNNRYGDARRLLKHLYDKDDVTADLAAIVRSHEEAVLSKERGLTLYAALGIPVYRNVIGIGCLLSAFQQLTGINVFVASSNSLFAEAGLEQSLITVMSTVLTLVNVLMTFPAIYLIEYLGRRTLLLIGVVGMTVSVLPGAIMLWVDNESEATSWVAIAGAILFIVFFSVSYGPVLWVYLFEIYPLEIKGSASGLATAVNWICGIVMVFVTNFISITVNYTIFAAMGICGTVVVFFFMRETKGRTLEDSPFLYDKQGRRIVIHH